jgi:hydroxypyruvate isomerase
VRLLFDAYHAAMAGLAPLDEAARVAPLVGHVQFADHPGRGAPGTGTLDLWALVDRLEALGYDGAVGLEFLPGGPTPPFPRRPESGKP